jgi:hypothetical protein
MASGAPTRPAPVDLAPVASAAPAEPEAVAAPAGAAPAAAARAASEPSVTRFTARDYSYVTRDLWRVAIIATGIIVMLIVLAFFLP